MDNYFDSEKAFKESVKNKDKKVVPRLPEVKFLDSHTHTHSVSMNNCNHMEAPIPTRTEEEKNG